MTTKHGFIVEAARHWRVNYYHNGRLIPSDRKAHTTPEAASSERDQLIARSKRNRLSQVSANDE